MKETTITRPKLIIFVLFVVFTVGLTSCGPNETVLKSNSPTPAPPGAAPTRRSSNDPVEKEVEAMQTADFNFIYVLRRRDGGVLDSDDKTFLRSVTATVNRRTLSNDQKAIIIGANNKLPPELIQSMKDRFNFEDFSKPDSQIANSNSPANANIKR
jgi:hypothetical protein